MSVSVVYLSFVRILQISSAKTFGGGERRILDLCRSLDDRGHEVFVALRPTNEWQTLFEFLPADRFLHLSVRNSFGMFNAKAIAGFLKDNGIDIIHAHLARDYLAAALAKRLTPAAKCVITRHAALPLKPFHRLALRNIDAAIAVSAGAERELAKSFPKEKIRLIPNGIAFGSYDRLDLGAEFRKLHSLNADAPLVGTIGQLMPSKGQRDFVLAANEIVKHVPDCRFVIAGVDRSIDKRFRRELRRLVSVLGLEDRFLWLDWIADLTPPLCAFDVFVSPAQAEGLGLVPLEAMAAGTAVVATDTAAAREIIGEISPLVPPNDALSIAASVIKLLSDEPLRRRTAERLRSAARTRYSADTMAEAVEKLYSDVLAVKA
ncbi:MAG: glycosyltransferase family 4 protein [Chloracidobacterium sp.]|nr:glycosyltransferase family 4 protein [Chloracidobacterium sp.]MCO5334751.1 glycosyltransferase family 4 protein [Pyrinomonadaceae bacterium]